MNKKINYDPMPYSAPHLMIHLRQKTPESAIEIRIEKSGIVFDLDDEKAKDIMEILSAIDRVSHLVYFHLHKEKLGRCPACEQEISKKSRSRREAPPTKGGKK